MRDESEECEAEESILAGSWYFVIIRYEGKWPAAEDCSQFSLGQTWGDTTEMNIKTQIQFPMSWIISNHLLGMSAGIETVGLVIVMVYQLILSLSRCFQSHLQSPALSHLKMFEKLVRATQPIPSTLPPPPSTRSPSQLLNPVQWLYQRSTYVSRSQEAAPLPHPNIPRPTPAHHLRHSPDAATWAGLIISVLASLQRSVLRR